MNRNSNFINISGTQITLINIEDNESLEYSKHESKYIRAAINCVESIKRNTFDFQTPFKVQQGSVACFGLLITHLGDLPSPFWFQKYKKIFIKSFKINETFATPTSGLKRVDIFYSTEFPGDLCLTNDVRDAFVLHLKHIPIQVNNSSIGNVIGFELEVSMDDFTESSTMEDLHGLFKEFKLTGRMIVNQTLVVDGFIKGSLLFLKLLNNEKLMDVEIKELVAKMAHKDTNLDLPILLNPGNQMNISIPLNNEFDHKSVTKSERNVEISMKWNLCQDSSLTHSISTRIEITDDEEGARGSPISITCSVAEVKNSKFTLKINVKVIKKMQLYLRVLDYKEPTQYKKLIPVHDFVDLGMVDEDDIQSYLLYFYYVTEGLHQTPKIEVIDKISNSLYKIDNKIFNIDPNCVD